MDSSPKITNSPTKTSSPTKVDSNVASPQKVPSKTTSPLKDAPNSGSSSPQKGGNSQPTSPQKAAPKSGTSSPKKADSQANSPKKIDSQPTSPKKVESPQKIDSPRSGQESPVKSAPRSEAESPIKPTPVSNTTESPIKQASEVAEPHSPQVDEQTQASIPIPFLDNVPKTSILIVAANGKLGSAITQHCLARKDLLVNILIRNVEKEKQLADSVLVKGGKVFQGDVTEPETLDEPTKGVHTVISCVNSTDDKIAVEGQNNLLQASLKNGVRRFVPSDFGVNYTKFSKEELERSSIVSPKIKFQEILDKHYNIVQLHFYQGMIMEMYFQLQAQGFSYWGDDSFKLELTCYDDIAKAVSVVVSEPYLGGTIVYVGQRLTNCEIGEIYSRVRGEKKEPHKNGEIDDLKAAYEEKRKEGVFDAEILGLYLLTTDERSLFGKDNNESLPTVSATTVEEFLKKHPDVKLP